MNTTVAKPAYRLASIDEIPAEELATMIAAGVLALAVQGNGVGLSQHLVCFRYY
jgi:hypothetical protein